MTDRSWYIFSLCREKALRGDVQLMMVREPAFHSEALMMGAFAALRQRSQIQVVRQPTPRQAARPVRVKQRRRRR